MTDALAPVLGAGGRGWGSARCGWRVRATDGWRFECAYGGGSRRCEQLARRDLVVAARMEDDGTADDVVFHVFASRQKPMTLVAAKTGTRPERARGGAARDSMHFVTGHANINVCFTATLRFATGFRTHTTHTRHAMMLSVARCLVPATSLLVGAGATTTVVLRFNKTTQRRPPRALPPSPFHTLRPLAAKPLPPRIKIDEADIEENFLKGSGPGGQKIVRPSPHPIALTRRSPSSDVRPTATPSH